MSATITIILTLGGWIIAGVLAIVGMFNKQKKQMRADDEQTSSNLINNLKITVDLQKDQLAKMQTDMDAHTKERNEEMQKLRESLSHLTGRNSLLEELFKGQDPNMQAFFKSAPEVVNIIQQDHELMKQSITSINALNDAVKKLVETIGDKKR